MKERVFTSKSLDARKGPLDNHFRLFTSAVVRRTKDIDIFRLYLILCVRNRILCARSQTLHPFTAEYKHVYVYIYLYSVYASTNSVHGIYLFSKRL